MSTGPALDGGQSKPPDPTSQVPGDGNSGRRWKFEVAWLGAIGIVVYVALRYPYAVYYERLGSSPEEVGLDYVNLLTKSSKLLVIAALIAGAVVIAIGLFVIITAAWGTIIIEFPDFWYALIRRPGVSGGGESLAAVFARHPVLPRGIRWKKWIVLYVVGYFLLFLLTVLPVYASENADSVKECGLATVTPNRGLDIFPLRPDPIRAYDSPDLKPKFPDRQLFLLGSSSSTYVLYDCAADATLRVPMGGVVLIRGTG